MTDRQRARAHAAVLRKHGFRRRGTTLAGSHRFKHPCGATAYYGYSPSKHGWRTRVKFRGLWGWTGVFYASAANLDRWLTLHK